MARRMFSPKVTSTDAFLDMSVSARELYFQLGMNADDDGFVTPRKIMRMVSASADDLNVLVAKGFVIPFKSGVIVITAWRVNNLIRKDWYQETIYLEEKAQLTTNDNSEYILVNNPLTNPLTIRPHRLGKDRLGKDRGLMCATRTTPVLKPRKTKKTTRDLTPVTPEESKKYICETMPNDKRAHIRIMAHYFQRKGFIFDTVDAREVSIKRNAKVASDLVGHPITDVLGTMEWLDNNSKDYDWKLETVLKTIDHYRAAWAKVNNNQI